MWERDPDFEHEQLAELVEVLDAHHDFGRGRYADDFAAVLLRRLPEDRRFLGLAWKNVTEEALRAVLEPRRRGKTGDRAHADRHETIRGAAMLNLLRSLGVNVPPYYTYQRLRRRCAEWWAKDRPRSCGREWLEFSPMRLGETRLEYYERYLRHVRECGASRP